MDGSAAIETTGLTKYYGRARGVVDLNLRVMPGSLLGFLGPNGAGKTTTIRLLMDFIRPSAGSARVLGLDSRRDHLTIASRIGYMSSEPGLYDDLTPRQHLRFSARLRGEDLPAQASTLARRLDLDLDRRLGEQSRGNRLKTALIAASPSASMARAMCRC